MERPAPQAPALTATPVVPRRLLLQVFLVGTIAALTLILLTGHPLTLGWLGAALLVGLLATPLVYASRLARHPARIAHAASGVRMKPHHEAMGGDPLAHIQVVEQQGRRHRRPCVNCGTMVKLHQGVCPNCDHQQVFACKGCRTQVRLEWTNCPECGRGLP